MPSSVIRVNQAGYAAGLPVRAAVLKEGPVILENENGEAVFKKDSIALQADEASGDSLCLLDLGVLAPGSYTLRCGDESRKFTVRPEAWREAGNALIKGLYFQRCGCELKKEHAGVYAHPACHTALATDWNDRSVRCLVTGGWHDAGDYGKYIGPGAVAAAHMMYAWKLFPGGCGDNLNIPETGNGLPDILNEVKYELDWLLKMQRPNGAFHHKLTKERFAGFIMPQDDLEPEYMMPESHCATGAACACLALASRIYRTYNEGFANTVLLSAKRAWDWLEQHEEDFQPFRNPEGVHTGEYGDRSDRDERFWAACELFAATKEEKYKAAAEKLYAEGQRLTSYGWVDVGGLGGICCLADLKEKAGRILYGQMKEDFLKESGKLLKLTEESGYRTALQKDFYIWGSILPIMGNAMAMILNYLLTGNEAMRAAAQSQLDYALGLNALDICFITGFGENRVMHIHHRPSGADNIEDPVPGLISGGPNKRWTYEATRQKLGEDIPPAKSFLDETFSADTNEIAIYWNSPAIFTFAFFNSVS